MLKKLLLLCTLLTGLLLNAQMPALEWAKSFGGTSIDVVNESRLDSQGNVISVGTFEDSVDIDPGPGVQMFHGPANGDPQIFIQKLNPQGNLIWAKTLPSTSTSLATCLVISGNDDILVGGYFTSFSFDMDPSPTATYTLSGTYGVRHAFVLRLDQSGNFVSAFGHGGNLIIQDIDLDRAGRIYILANFNGQFDEDINPTTTTPSYNPLRYGFFIERINTAGNQDYLEYVRSSGDVQAHTMKLINGKEPIIVGEYDGTVDFNPGPPANVLPVPVVGTTRGFILQLNGSGGFKRVHGLQGNGTSKLMEIQTDGAMNLYVAGSHKNQVDFDPTGTVTTSSSSTEGWFVSKMDTLGNLQWINPFSNSLSSMITGALKLGVDSNGSFHITGYYRDVGIYFEPGKLQGTSLNNLNSRDIFLARYNASGQILWAQQFASIGSELPRSFFRDNSGALYISGYFGSTISFDPYNSSATHTTTGSLECYVVKFGTCAPARDSIIQLAACNSYVKNGITYLSDTLLPIDTLKNIIGCDSLITKEEVKITPIQSNITLSNNGTFNWVPLSGGPYSYQWYRCDNDSILTGRTNDSLRATQNGSYALIIELNGCRDTSACVTINNVGLQELNPLEFLTVYPNPVNKVLYISGSEDEVYDLTLSDISGRKVMEHKKSSSLDVSQLPAGTYFLRIEQGLYSVVRKVLVR